MNNRIDVRVTALQQAEAARIIRIIIHPIIG